MQNKEIIVRRMLLKYAAVDFICDVAEVSREYVIKAKEEIQSNN